MTARDTDVFLYLAPSERCDHRPAVLCKANPQGLKRAVASSQIQASSASVASLSPLARVEQSVNGKMDYIPNSFFISCFMC
eukprot:6193353-Pleurochrysis_carterae.AAC.3